MAISYTWTIANLERNTANGGVTVAHWRCTGDDGNGNIASSYGTTSHSPDPDAAGFIAFDDLTEADVLGWVHGVVDQAETESSIEAQINEMANPTTSDGLPW